MNILDLLLQLLVLALVFALVWWVVGMVLNALAPPAPIGKIVQAIVAVVFLILVLGMFFGGLSMPSFRR